MFYQSEISFQRCRREHVFCFQIMAAFSSGSDQKCYREEKIPLFEIEIFPCQAMDTQSSHAYMCCPSFGSKKSISLLLLDKYYLFFPPTSKYSIFHLQFLPLHFNFFIFHDFFFPLYIYISVVALTG